MFWNKRKKKIAALEALLNSSAEVAKIQKREIEALERTNSKLMNENDKLLSENKRLDQDCEIIRSQNGDTYDKISSLNKEVERLGDKNVGLLSERKQLRATITRISNKLKKLQADKPF